MINDQKVIDEILKILNNISTYKSRDNVYLSDGSSFTLPKITTIVLSSNSKSYR